MENLGSALRARREACGYTLDDIAARTKIPRRRLVELEQNRIGEWPASRVYQVGYLRAYAVAVGCDPAQVIAQFDSEIAASGGSAAAPIAPARAGRRLRVLPLALALGVGSALLVALPRYEQARPAAAETPIVSPLTTDIALPPPSAETTAVSTSGGLAESDAVEGELRIDSDPPGTRVVINGIGRGSTPLRIRYLPAGSYTIRLVQDGYESREVTATISADRPVRTLSVRLRARDASGEGSSRHLGQR
jgi:transcriptional regulator with XRE-family HTH domain